MRSSPGMTAMERVEQVIQRIETLNPQFNAFTHFTFERARREAADIDRRIQGGETLGPLAGIPYAVKNLFDIQGMTTVAGSMVHRHAPPASEDAVLVARLKAAGAVLLGALNMDEYAYGFTTENSHDGPTRNPHDVTCVAGGSSGGSGAAVAAGMVPLTLGSDTNGSIRVPSSLCGVWGMKPTFGRLSRRGTFPFVNSLDHLGPMADSVHLLAASYDAMQGPDSQDPGCHATHVQPTVQQIGLGIRGLRIGVLSGYFQDFASESARASVSRVATALGATAEVTWPDAAYARAAAFIVTASEGGALHLEDLRRCPQDFEPLSVDRFMAGALQPAAWYVRAQRFRSVYRDKVQALFQDWDILLAPATPVCAQPIGTEWLDIQGQKLPCRAAMGLLTQPISFAGCPVVTAPVWPSGLNGLPLGVQLIAAPWREDLALRAAHTLEAMGAAQLKEHTA
jgi:amidase/aspartyl-tRNA(Asn)/glutamyl-tRNA(Gln) amidotransferase subunit A